MKVQKLRPGCKNLFGESSFNLELRLRKRRAKNIILPCYLIPVDDFLTAVGEFAAEGLPNHQFFNEDSLAPWLISNFLQ